MKADLKKKRKTSLIENNLSTPHSSETILHKKSSYHKNIRNRVDWPIEIERCALLIHDMQPHYLQILNEKNKIKLIKNISEISSVCIDKKIPIFASQVLPVRSLAERGLMLDMWGEGPSYCNSTIEPDIGLSDKDFRYINKRSYSAFYGNDLEVLLRRSGRNQLIIVGVYTSIGCRISAIDAFMRDIKTFLISDATADMTEIDHEIGLGSAAHTCSMIINTRELINQVQKKE